MPANATQSHHHHHHHHNHHHDNILNPNPNTNPNTNPPPKPNPKLLSLLLKSIIMVLIISLFFLFLGIATLALLHFFLAGGRALHRRRPHPTTTYSAEDLRRHLPRQKYAAGDFPGDEDCAVCLEFFREGEWCRSLPDCRHVFHAVCVDKWLTKVPNCPVCRARVRLDSEAAGPAMGEDDCKLLWAVGV